MLCRNVTSLAAFGFCGACEELRRNKWRMFSLSTVMSFWLRKMQKSNYPVTLITLLIITVTLSHYLNSPDRKCRLPYWVFTLLMAHCQGREHGIVSPLPFCYSVHCVFLCLGKRATFCARACAPPPHDFSAAFEHLTVPEVSPEPSLILASMLDGDVCVYLEERGEDSLGWGSSYRSGYLTIAVYVAVKQDRACSVRFLADVCQPLAAYCRECGGALFTFTSFYSACLCPPVQRDGLPGTLAEWCRLLDCALDRWVWGID